MVPAMTTYKIKTIRALDRGLEVLAFLQAARAASLHDMHLATGLPKATLIRIVATLEQRGLIWQRIADGAHLPNMDQPAEFRQIVSGFLQDIGLL